MEIHWINTKYTSNKIHNKKIKNTHVLSDRNADKNIVSNNLVENFVMDNSPQCLELSMFLFACAISARIPCLIS